MLGRAAASRHTRHAESQHGHAARKAQAAYVAHQQVVLVARQLNRVTVLNQAAQAIKISTATAYCTIKLRLRRKRQSRLDIQYGEAANIEPLT